MKFAATELPTGGDWVLVICVGNALRGDDGVGEAVARELASSAAGGAAAPASTPLHVVNVHQLTPELALPVSRARLAIVVDAATDLPPGRVRRASVSGPGGAATTRASAFHHQTVAGVLGHARQAFGRAPEAWAITVGGLAWEYGQRLSPPVRTAVPRVLHEIDLIVASRAPATADAEATAGAGA